MGFRVKRDKRRLLEHELAEFLPAPGRHDSCGFVNHQALPPPLIAKRSVDGFAQHALLRYCRANAGQAPTVLYKHNRNHLENSFR